MFIHRDIAQQLNHASTWVQVMMGPRQCGKSTLLASLTKEPFYEITFDDLSLRQLANTDPELFLQQFPGPLLLDEVQYVPNLFPEIKRLIDLKKREHLTRSNPPRPVPIYRLTGSNQILLDKNIKESLAGRAQYYYLNTLSVHEILQALPETPLGSILFNGGWPELYSNPYIQPIPYLNDYIRSYVEKDIALSSGIQKLAEFHTVLRLFASRTAQIGDYTEIAKAAGIKSATVKEWVSLLERADLIFKLPAFSTNLNKRLTKSPKWYFLDTGLATRLQGWSEVTPLLHSPQAGPLFETLALSEIIKFIRNMGKNWHLHLWRTKEQEEIDFILETERNVFYAFDAKLSLQEAPEKYAFPNSYKKIINPKHPLAIITFGNKKLARSTDSFSLPITELFDYLESL